MSLLVRIGCASAILGVAACGGGAPPPEEPKAEQHETVSRPQTGGPQMQQELGSIDERAVAQTFQRLTGQTEGCHAKGRDRVEYLAGDVKVFLRIDANGKVRYGYFEESTLGDRETEKCILEVFKSATWPKPVGGEAEVRNGFGWGPGGEREPTSWGPEKVLEALGEAKAVKKSLDKCQSGVKGDFHVTGYVVASESAEEDAAADGAERAAKGKGAKPKPGAKGGHKDKHDGGKFLAVGVATSTKEAAERSDCVVDALRELPLPSPGSYAAKVAYTF